MRLLFILIAIIAFSSCVFCQETKQETQKPVTRIEIDENSQLKVKLILSEIEKAEQALLLARKDLILIELTLRKILNIPDEYEFRMTKDGKFFFEKPPSEKPK